MNEFLLVKFLIFAIVIVCVILFVLKKSDLIKRQSGIWRNGIKDKKLNPIAFVIVAAVVVLLYFLKDIYKKELTANPYIIIAFLLLVVFIRLIKKDDTEKITGECLKCKKVGKLFFVVRGIDSGYYCRDCYAVTNNEGKRMFLLFFISMVIASVALVAIVIYFPDSLDKIGVLLNQKIR